MNNHKGHVTIDATQMRQIAGAILDLLRQGEKEPADIIQALSDRFDVWQIRETIWDLTAKAAAELTWDRKLKLGKYSEAVA